MSVSQTPEIPPEPIKPDPGECCGRGCERCIFIYYEEALQRWKDKVAAIKSDASTTIPD